MQRGKAGARDNIYLSMPEGALAEAQAMLYEMMILIWPRLFSQHSSVGTRRRMWTEAYTLPDPHLMITWRCLLS
jgi:hypothetical protein